MRVYNYKELIHKGDYYIGAVLITEYVVLKCPNCGINMKLPLGANSGEWQIAQREPLSLYPHIRHADCWNGYLRDGECVEIWT